MKSLLAPTIQGTSQSMPAAAVNLISSSASWPGLPVPSPQLKSHGALMVNLLGLDPDQAAP